MTITQEEWDAEAERQRSVYADATRRLQSLAPGDEGYETTLERATAARQFLYSRRPDADYFAPEGCRVGFTYAIYSRNLSFGVYTGGEGGGFVGIREKFGDLYLFTEYHRDLGGSFGTVAPYEELERCPVSDLREYLGSVCTLHGRPAEFRRLNPDGSGWWFHSDDGTMLPRERVEGEPFDSTRAVRNTELFRYLEGVEERFSWDEIMARTRNRSRES